MPPAPAVTTLVPTPSRSAISATPTNSSALNALTNVRSCRSRYSQLTVRRFVKIAPLGSTAGCVLTLFLVRSWCYKQSVHSALMRRRRIRAPREQRACARCVAGSWTSALVMRCSDILEARRR